MSRPLQHVICPTCGQLFRARCHSVGCADAGFDAGLADLANAVHRDHLKGQLEELIKQHDERTDGERTDR